MPGSTLKFPNLIHLLPGMTTLQIDNVARKMLELCETTLPAMAPHLQNTYVSSQENVNF